MPINKTQALLPATSGGSVGSNVSVTNFPAVQQITGSSGIDGLSFVSGALSIFVSESNPVSITGNVGITNFPSIQNITGSVTVNSVGGTVSTTVTNTPTITGSVQIVGIPLITGSVQLVGIPSVNINNSPSVSITGTPAITGSVTVNSVGGIVTTNISGTPTITGSIQVVGIPLITGSVQIVGIPTITGSVSITSFPADQTITGSVTVNSVGGTVSTAFGFANKTIVARTGSITTTTTGANQSVLSYTVTAGKYYYIQFVSLQGFVTAVALTGSYLGKINLEIPSGTVASSFQLSNTSTGDIQSIILPFAEPLPISSSQVIAVSVTPAVTTNITWKANIVGYER